MSLIDIKVHQQDTQVQLVTWRVVGVDTTPSAVVRVYRAYAENGDFLLIGTVPASQTFFIDQTVNLSNTSRYVFYKLVFVDFELSSEYGPIRIDGDLTGPALGAVRASQTLLRISGQPVLVFQRRFEGTRCSCWDVVMQQGLDANCDSCYSTTYVGGFYPPILTLSSIIPEDKRDTLGDTLRQNTSTQCMFANYPVIRPRDMIYELDQGRRYRVVGVSTVEHGRVIVNQTCELARLNTSDIENSLPIPDLRNLTPVIGRSVARSREYAVTVGESVEKVWVRI